MSLDDIWDEPVASPAGDAAPAKRPRQSLFLSDSDSDNDNDRPPKRATPAPPPDVDDLFADVDNDETNHDDDDDDLAYKPLAPALDIAKLTKEAEERHARATQTGGSAVGSKNGTAGKDQSGKDEGKSKPGDGETRGRKVLPKLDEERLVGREGFPMLLEDIKGFRSEGKGNEHADLNRLLQVYQFWTHRMYPKMSFKDMVVRVEKLCHSKRMQVRLSVWRDEFKGVAKDQPDEDPDVIDLTEPTLVGNEADDGGDKDSDDTRPNDDQPEAISRPPSFPPTSPEMDDDEMDLWDQINSAETQIPTSGVNIRPLTDSASSGNTFRATNDDDDWDEMYS